MGKEERRLVFNHKIQEMTDWFEGYMEELAMRHLCDIPRLEVPECYYEEYRNNLLADEVNKVLTSMKEIQRLNG